jgi:hypothetical protein
VTIVANADDTSTIIEPPAASVVRVGGGRGFIVTGDDDRKLIITAGHCLPFVPPCINFSDLSERTYKRLIGLIGQKPKISAECMFVDSISDLAVLGPPDNQELSEECDAYEAFVESLVSLSVADVLRTPLPVDGRQPEGATGWVLSLDGEWQQCRMSHFGGPLWLTGVKIKGGMSGSPILSANGSAVGLIASNHAQPRLLHSLPGWILRAQIRRMVREKVSPARKPAVAARNELQRDGRPSLAPESGEHPDDDVERPRAAVDRHDIGALPQPQRLVASDAAACCTPAAVKARGAKKIAAKRKG